MTPDLDAIVEPCAHRDGYGSTVVFVQDRPQDGVCLLCDEEFPALRIVEPEMDPCGECPKGTCDHCPGCEFTGSFDIEREHPLLTPDPDSEERT